MTRRLDIGFAALQCWTGRVLSFSLLFLSMICSDLVIEIDGCFTEAEEDLESFGILSKRQRGVQIRNSSPFSEVRKAKFKLDSPGLL